MSDPGKAVNRTPLRWRKGRDHKAGLQVRDMARRGFRSAIIVDSPGGKIQPFWRLI
ncbi:hypothetical protein [uncultured Bosea sp.]|uniref:hypothetical protein n=1 Tax=uncultured Bosea sp. TaxID=211457 RepID=UPI0025CE32B7|nr:hypothetical protein [uncultured Bosea sp.]